MPALIAAVGAAILGRSTFAAFGTDRRIPICQDFIVIEQWIAIPAALDRLSFVIFMDAIDVRSLFGPIKCLRSRIGLVVVFTGRNLLELHPTVKPVALVADAIMDVSARGEIVLDSFLGSGTTLIAAERTGRICYGMELDPLYVDTIIRRWQKFTGLSAAHADSGRSFDELEKEAANAIQ